MALNLRTMMPYSRMASCGVTFTVKRPGRASRTVPPVRGAPSSGATRSCAFTSHTSTRFPARAASRASAAETVDFPTPPFPVTITRRRSRRVGLGTRLDKLTRGGGQVHHAVDRRRPQESAAPAGAPGGRGAGREGGREGARERERRERGADPPVRRGPGARDDRARRHAGAARREPPLEGRRRLAPQEARGARGDDRRPRRARGSRSERERRPRVGESPMRRIAFINEKGGTCKTTLCVNVAARL